MKLTLWLFAIADEIAGASAGAGATGFAGAGAGAAGFGAGGASSGFGSIMSGSANSSSACARVQAESRAQSERTSPFKVLGFVVIQYADVALPSDHAEALVL